MKRNIYLKMKSLKEAREIMFRRFPDTSCLPSETVSVEDAGGRVLAEPVFARLSSPNFHSAAMDGIAVKAEHTFGTSETRPTELVIGENAFYLNTGHLLPPNTDAVIMIEHVTILDERRVRIEAPAFPWQHVRKMGEDIVATELLFTRNHVVTPYCLGALLAGGITSLVVRRRPKVFIIPTGSELIDWQDAGPEDLLPGQVIESNSYVLGNLVEAWGGRFIRHEKVMDSVGALNAAVTEAVSSDYDLVLMVGGSSAGSEDYSKRVIGDLGEILVHGVTIMPGKPVLVGAVEDKPVFGVPGYPVSAIVAFEQFVRPLMLRMLGRPEERRQTVTVEPTRKIPSKLGVEEFVRVKLGRVADRIAASSLPRGAGIITSLTEADGIVRIPANSEGLTENKPVTAELLRPLESINHTIVAVGSHDNTLDVLTDQLKARSRPVVLSSSHVGSLGGLMAIKRGACHLAGSHLLDTQDGSYNVTYIRRYLPDIAVKLVHLVMREQGMIVAPGNPKGLSGIKDLSRKDVTFINRQGGSGTRILLDYRLSELGIDPRSIQGYDTEEYTHMAVAVAVLGGTADTGLGIFAAANALKLDFIPVVTEQYDLVIPEAYFESDNIQSLLETIRSSGFQQRVDALGGYDTQRTGEVLPL
ncbi:Molybdopterin molybdenumtransferase (EC / Periplasmic molybdate-binding domain [Olavius algarvensis associated proteobacterium Delta 3]|nr:Molybdopterin molybdenumtransferase (EC / Periplasmic molybdate-binding domain [Olavius algarvensis associated proteobacterium Delta 3]CAB5103060.1 Molybdopterin molybdenumtransferase (EC / Periplasmic molybdate-binding domain [Olavius algarvensis associated proteobacterium Delta 3]